jgi:DNA-binding transcriptional regulator YiaG
VFYKSSEIEKEMKVKIDVITNGKNARELITSVIKYSDITLVVAPSDKQDEFINEFNTHKSKNGRVKKSVYDMELNSEDLKDYVLIHKKDYEKFLSFEKTKILDLKQIEKIKKESLKGLSQRSIAKSFGVSVATINKILNDKY